MAIVKNLMVRAGADFSAITKQSVKAKTAMSGMQTSVTKSCSRMNSALSGLKKAFGALGAVLSAAAIGSFSKSAKEAYDTQAEAEAKLAQVMRNTIGASNEEIKAIKDLTAAQQALGVIGDEVQLAGAQELATYVTMTSTLETLIPVMNDMVAQQYGLSASGENAAGIATMLGKVLSGQTSALSRYGYTFTAAQEEILKYGTEAQRAATLAEVVEESVGGMNAALAATPSGRLQQVSNTMGDLKENFGQAVSSLLTTALPVLNLVCSGLASMATLANKAAQAVANVFGGGKSSAAAVVAYTAAAAGSMDDLTDSTQAAGSAAEKLNTFGFDQITKLTDQSDSTAADAAADVSGLGGGNITESTAAAGEAGESVGWLEAALARLKGTVDSLSFDSLSSALDRLKTAAEPLNQALFTGLGWAYDNIFEPMAQWTVESALPGFLDVLGQSAAACSQPLERLGTAVAPLVSTAFEGLRWAYDNVLIPFGAWAGGELLPAWLDALAGEANILSSVLVGLKPVGTWLWDNFLAPLAEWTGGVIVNHLTWVSDVLSGIGTWLQNNPQIVEAAAAAIIAVLEGIKNKFSLVFGIIEGLFTGSWDNAKAAWDACVSWFSTYVIEPLQAAFKVVTSAAAGFFSAAWDGIKSAWNVAAAWFANTVVTPVQTAFSTAASAVAGFFSGAWNNVKGAWNAASAWFSNTIITPIKTAFSAVTSAVAGFFSGAWDNVKGAWNAAGSWFAANVINPITGGFKGFVNGIIGFFEGLVNGAIRGVNILVGALNNISFDIPDWVPVIGGGKFGFHLATRNEIRLPRLATGGVVDRPTPALVGEAGPEAVVPLSENAAWLDALAARLATLIRTGVAKLTIPVYVGGRKATQMVIDDINQIISTTGEIPIHI